VKEHRLHKRHQHLNIPIEIVRTVVAISESGSLSKAGERLGLSQPAVSSQIKRIQTLVGGSLFERTPNGTKTTELGKLVLFQARRILEANDQMLRLGGAIEGSPTLRIGLSTLFVRDFVRHQSAKSLGDIFTHTDHSATIAKGLVDGFIDVACIFESAEIGTEIDHLIINEFSVPLIWVRSKDFVLSHNAPIPILTWPGDDWMIRTLTQHGVAYKIVFNGPDYYAKLSAVEAGIGLTAIPVTMLPANLVHAKEYYLPTLPSIKALLCSRPEADERKALVLKQLSSMFFKSN
jgi:DNA-binding transcriptional LysR family regulator